MYNEETIIALSTPAGRGAIAIIRISGPNTLQIIQTIIRKPSDLSNKINSEFILQNTRKLLRAIIYHNNEVIDDGMFVFFGSPNSYTGEDMAEIYIHGNPLIAKKIINIVSSYGLARPSLPGEFTRRAFLNEKMDLTRAESIHRIITAKSEYELNAVKKIYFGDLYKLINRIRSELILLKAQIEAEVDFSDQDIDYSEKDQIKQKVNQIISMIQDVLKKSAVATRISQGIQIALVGKTNAGKSSLLNKILGWDRSIVSDIEGTTRDYISEEIELARTLVRIVDTAGLRETKDQIEKEGIRRSKEAMEKSQIILHIIDGSIKEYPFLPEIDEFVHSKDSYKKIIHIINKKDCLHKDAWNEEKLKRYANHEVIVKYISCKTGEGIEDLKQTIESFIKNQFQIQDPFLLEERHHYHFNKIIESLKRVNQLFDENAPEEIIAIEIQDALNHISELTGEITTEDILGRIFSMFCIGK
ncbi:MAG: tRNA modification GTPase MnmE [Leptospiraceae bacterium]|nr:MAG: tRNA modification GTPase MnmE [Leptospiraceae bacterium]